MSLIYMYHRSVRHIWCW